MVRKMYKRSESTPITTTWKMEDLEEVQQISPDIEQEEYILQMLRESDAEHREQVVLAFMEEVGARIDVFFLFYNAISGL